MTAVEQSRADAAVQQWPRAARAVASWLRAQDPDPDAEPFRPEQLTRLPEPARRWLTRAIDAGTPLARQAELHMHGRIDVGGHWRDFTALQVLAPRVGFVWAAYTQLGPFPISGFDAYADGEGRMRWRMAGLPLYSDSSPDVTASNAGRLAAEAVLLPTSLVGAHWSAGPDSDSATVRQHVAGRNQRPRVTVTVDADGRLRRLSMLRWGKPAGVPFGEHRFEVDFDGEFDADGMRLPDGMRAAWALPDGRAEFLAASIDTARFGGAT